MAFTGPLKFFNSVMKTTSQRAEFLGENSPLELSATQLGELVGWIILHVSTNASECEAAWSDLYKFVNNSTAEFVTLSANSVSDKDAVADLLTEVLRVCNFARHDKHIIAQFLTIMTKCGIAVVGDPEVCKSLATFAKLGYSATTHQVTMASQ